MVMYVPDPKKRRAKTIARRWSEDRTGVIAVAWIATSTAGIIPTIWQGFSETPADIAMVITLVMTVACIVAGYGVGKFAGGVASFIDWIVLERWVKKGHILDIPKGLLEICRAAFQQEGIQFDTDVLSGEYYLLKDLLDSYRQMQDHRTTKETREIVRASIIRRVRPIAQEQKRELTARAEGAESYNAGIQAAHIEPPEIEG